MEKYEEERKEPLSLYQELDRPVICFHNRNTVPYVDVPHLHSQYEFYYNIDGAQGLFADKKFYECSGRDLFFLPRLCVHKVMVPKNVHYERCIINIDSKVIDGLNAALDQNRPLGWLEGVGNPVPRKVNLDEAAHNKFVELIDGYHSVQNVLLRYARLIEILAFLGEYFAVGRESNERIRTPRSVPEQALLLVEENFRDIRISDISEKLYINSSYLSVIFKEEYGITLEQYLIIRKIAEAKKYLYLGVPVSEVCRLCGFHNDSNFSRTFKKYEGYSPRKLERLHSPL